MRLCSFASISTIFCALTLLPGLAAAGEPLGPPGYTVELIWSASDNGEAVGVGTDEVTAIVGDTLTLDVYLSVYDDGATENSLYSYFLSVSYDPTLITASEYLPAADDCSGSPPNEVCSEASAWFDRSGGTILLKPVFPSTPPGEDPDNFNTIHWDEEDNETGIVGSIQGEGVPQTCAIASDQAVNDRVKVASMDFTVLPAFAAQAQLESLFAAGDALLATCIAEVPPEDVDLRTATIVPEPTFAALQIAALGCLVGLRRRRSTS